MKKLYVYIVVIMIVVVQSCKQEEAKTIVVDKEDGLKVQIKYSAGDEWDESDNFLPLPFNIASSGEEDMLVLSERIKKGVSLDVKPIGAIRIVQNDTLLTYVISIPVAPRYKSFSPVDFDEFSTVYSSAKWIIEQYMLNRKNTNMVKLKSWENESFAINYLLK